MSDSAETVQKAFEGERWPPVLKEAKECSHFPVLEPYLYRFDFEVNPLLYPFKDFLPLHMCQKFLKQVREGWGYDVNVCAPWSPFIPIERCLIEEEGGSFQEYVVPDCKDLVGKINNKAKEHGVFYVFDELKKAVMLSGVLDMLITFSVREVSSNKLERVRVCFNRDATIAQWSFKGKGQYEEEDGIIYELPAGWFAKFNGGWLYAEPNPCSPPPLFTDVPPPPPRWNC